MKKIFLSLGLMLVTGTSLFSFQSCPMNYSPVCGVVNVIDDVKQVTLQKFHTFGNECVLNNSSYTLSHIGECTPSEIEPVDNYSHLKKINIHI